MKKSVAGYPQGVLMARDKGDEIVFDSPPPLVPEGLYELKFTGHEYARMFRNNTKLIMNFRVTTFGAYFEVKLQRFYNIKKQTRSYRATSGMDFTREMRNCFNDAVLKKGMPFNLLRDRVILASVRTVTQTSRQKSLGDRNRYSVVGEILGIQE